MYMECIHIYNIAQSGTAISCLLPPRIWDYYRRGAKGLQGSEIVDVFSQTLLARHESTKHTSAPIGCDCIQKTCTRSSQLKSHSGQCGVGGRTMEPHDQLKIYWLLREEESVFFMEFFK